MTMLFAALHESGWARSFALRYPTIRQQSGVKRTL